MGRLADLGTIEPGKAADLVILEADPTRDAASFRRIRFVVRGGVIRSRGELLVRVDALDRRDAASWSLREYPVVSAATVRNMPPSTNPRAPARWESHAEQRETTDTRRQLFLVPRATCSAAARRAQVVSGYSGESARTDLRAGATGHRPCRVVQVTFDPDEIAYGDLLRNFHPRPHDAQPAGADVNPASLRDLLSRPATARGRGSDSGRAVRRVERPGGHRGEPIEASIRRITAGILRAESNQPYRQAVVGPKVAVRKRRFDRLKRSAADAETGRDSPPASLSGDAAGGPGCARPAE